MIKLAILWILWCALHSWLISMTVTGWLRNHLGDRYRYYRLTYNLFAMATLIPILDYSLSLSGPALISWQREGMIVRWLLLAVCGGLFMAGARHYDLKLLVGIRQARTGGHHATLNPVGELDSSGIMGVTRHPWYLASLLLVWTIHRTIDLPALIVSTILSLYLVVGTVLEERKLVREHGDTYRNYQRDVSMIIPFRYLSNLVGRRTGRR